MKKWTATRIRELRGKLNLTQAEFAHMLRVKEVTVQTWEQGKGSPIGPATLVFDVLESLDQGKSIDLGTFAPDLASASA